MPSARRPGAALAAVAVTGLVLTLTACQRDSSSREAGAGRSPDPAGGPATTTGPAGPAGPAGARPAGAGPGATEAPSTAGAGRRRVVAPTGRDAGEGTEAAPWATLGHALAQLEPGDTLLVRGGRYRERVTAAPLREGRADARITVAAFPGERPVLEGLLWLDRPSHWTVTGLEVTWADRDGRPDQPMVKVVDGVGWRLEGNRLSGARSVAALLVTGTRPGEPSDWAVAGNCIHDTHRTNAKNADRLVAVDPGLEAGPGVIERNVLFGAPNGAGVELGGTGPRARGAAGVTVAHNTVYDTAQGVVVAGRSTGNQIRANLLGRTREEYAIIRGHRLEGAGNVAGGNVGFQSSALLRNDEGFRGVQDAGNRFPVDPRFDAVGGCEGFRPQAPEAAGAGHLAPG